MAYQSSRKSDPLIPDILRALVAERSCEYIEAILRDRLELPDIPSRTERKFNDAVAELDVIISAKRRNGSTIVD